jgi:hypothetical protein
MVRTPARLGIVAILGLDLLAAFGFAALVRGHRRLWMAAALALVVLVDVFPYGLHSVFREVPEPSPASRWLAAAPHAPVLELPWNGENDSTLYMYWSTVHWQPLVNGAGSFDARGNYGLGLIGNRWPSGYTRRVYREYGIRYVVVHLDRLTPGQLLRLRTAPLPAAVHCVADLGRDRVYTIDPGPPGGDDPTADTPEP